MRLGDPRKRRLLVFAVPAALLLCISHRLFSTPPANPTRRASQHGTPVLANQNVTPPHTQPGPQKPEPKHKLLRRTSPPPTPCPKLSRERIWQAAKTNQLGLVVVTFANGALLDFALNWLAHIRKTSLKDAALVGATDPDAKARLASHLECFALDSAIGKDEAKWGSPGFAHMGRSKAALTEQIVSLNVTVLLADADVVFVRDPLPYIARQLNTGAHVLFHTDAFSSQLSREWMSNRNRSSQMLRKNEPSLLVVDDPHIAFGAELNTGLFVLTPAAAILATEWVEAVGRPGAFDNWKNDQQAFNELVRKRLISRGGSDYLILLRGRDGGVPVLRLGLMPVHLFPSGHVFFLQRLPYKMGIMPIAVHLTFQNCDAAGKRSRMREAGLWELDPSDHYSPQNGILTYTNHLPEHLTAQFAPLSRDLKPDDDIVDRHFKLMYHQLAQFRSALLLAIASNRTLVLPRFLCGLESVTNFAHRGIRCRECAMDLPYWCPADHVLRMHYLEGSMPQIPAMRLPVVEHSLLEKRDAELKESVLEIEFSGIDKAESCPPHICLDTGGYLHTKSVGAAPFGKKIETSVESSVGNPAISLVDLPTQLVQYTNVKRWHISSQLNAVTAALDPAVQRKVEQTLLYLGGGFCCVSNPGGKGHYWYDLFFDRKEHTDRWGRRWGVGRLWKPEPGP